MRVAPRLRLGIAIAVPVCLLATGVIAADSLRFRYGLEVGPCVERIIFDQDGDMDVVGIGGSRLRNAFDPQKTRELFRTQHNRSVETYSLGRARHGPDHDYAILRDLFDRHRVKHLLVMADQERSTTYSPVAYSVSTTRDLWTALDGRPHARIEHFAVTLKHQLMRIRDVLLLVPRDRGWSKRVASHVGRLRGCLPEKRKVKKNRVQAALQERRRRGFREIQVDMRQSDQEFAVYWYRRIAALARAHGATVSFIYVPRIACCHWSDRSAELFEQVVGAPLWRVPVALHDKMVNAGYRDQTHLSERGREIFLPWLTARLSETL